MAAHDLDNQLAVDQRHPAHPAMVASGLWLRAGFVALSVEAIVLIMLATGELAAWAAIAAAVVAGVFARGSWHRARAALDAEPLETGGAASDAPRQPLAGGIAARVGTAVPR